MPSATGDVLELDALWSFVGKKSNKRWVWLALCRQTRQVVAYFIGDHSLNSCWQLWQWIPASYRHCQPFSDFWDTYQKVFGDAHQSVGNLSSELN